MFSYFKAPNLIEWLWLLPLRGPWGLAHIALKFLVNTVLLPLTYILSLSMRPVMDGLNMASVWAGDNKNKRWYVMTFVSLAISFLSLLLFVTPLVAIALILSIYVHEQLHGLGYFRVKNPYYIVFIGFLGAAAVTSDQNYAKLKQYDKSIMLLLGPFGSLLMGLFWFVMASVLPDHATMCMMLGGFNLTLVLFNMVALGALDGGRIYLSLMGSIREKDEKFVSIPLLLLSAIILISVFLRSFRFEMILFFLLLKVIGFLTTKDKDNPADAYSVLAMNRKELFIIVACYLGLILVGSILYPYFPDWSSMFTIAPWISENVLYLVAGLIVIGAFVGVSDLVHRLEKNGKNLPVFGALTFLIVLAVNAATFILFYSQLGLAKDALLFTLCTSTLLGLGCFILSLKWKKTYEAILAKRKQNEIKLEGLMLSED